VPDSCPSPAADLEATPEKAIAACGGDAREAVKALLVACDFREAKVAKPRSAVSSGYARNRQPRDRTGD
jgi:hypothetical protein